MYVLVCPLFANVTYALARARACMLARRTAGYSDFPATSTPKRPAIYVRLKGRARVIRDCPPAHAEDSSRPTRYTRNVAGRSPGRRLDGSAIHARARSIPLRNEHA
eukprot:13207161-Alexandrium_andersonii.AAC.1